MSTPLDALVASLRESASYNAAAEAPPEAAVWCDTNNDFLSLVPSLRDRLPELFTYGDYSLADRTGPAVWLRAATAGAINGVTWPEGLTPIIYLPGVGREILKGAEDCPALLQPLVWFTVAGSFFGHVNGKDWTLRAFLVSERGALRLRINDDAATRSALAAAAPRFFSRPVDELKTKTWDADQFNSLLAPDLDADMLDWIDGHLNEAADPARFQAFANLSAKQLDFDPRKLGFPDAVRRLTKRDGRWRQIWARFEGANGYEGVVAALALQEPTNLFDHGDNPDAYPKLNSKGETKLRQDLLSLSDLSPETAKARIMALEDEHCWRRQTIWARRGDAPLAQALTHLVAVAAAKPLPPHDGQALATAYVDHGCTIDWAAMQALAAAPRQIDREAVTAAIRAIYLPWLEEGAVALQELLKTGKLKLATPPTAAPDATTILFVDGFRMDLAHELKRRLAGQGLNVALNWSWSGFPTVTATCKPMVTPVAHLLSGPPQTSDVLPIAPDGKAASKSVLYKLMKNQGWETDSALLPDQKLWAETADFDEEGHALGAKLAERLDAGIRDTADSVMQLIRAGRNVRIVTDHGWLLMPGGLQVATLDAGLTEANGKRTRCAMVKSRAETSYLQLPWTWNDQVYVAAATGARSFYAAYEYAHGGVSPQECILPVMDISGSAASSDVSITEARWEGLRLRIAVVGGADLRADVRLGIETAGISLAKGGRVLDEQGMTSVLLSDEHEGDAASIVILDDHDRVVAHRTTKVGGE
tara:strand:+ start:63067 stop:65349 length:2283 start_codon:yes stop_codon:yes gene_type:complete